MECSAICVSSFSHSGEIIWIFSWKFNLKNTFITHDVPTPYIHHKILLNKTKMCLNLPYNGTKIQNRSWKDGMNEGIWVVVNDRTLQSLLPSSTISSVWLLWHLARLLSPQLLFTHKLNLLKWLLTGEKRCIIVTKTMRWVMLSKCGSHILAFYNL